MNLPPGLGEPVYTEVQKALVGDIGGRNIDKGFGGRKRMGSRPLLAIALLAGIVAAFSIGSLVPGILAGLLGIDSNGVRLALKVVAVAVAIPAMFYLVERLFLGRGPRRK